MYDTGPRKAKNVILLIGDGLSPAHRVAARLMSKGIAEGKAFGKLAMDDMPQMAMVATAGSDSIITDSANSASAYATGHKSAVNAMGVYADRTADPFDDPKVETISSLVKRRDGLSVGVVTNTEIQDATPAAMIAHTRRRATYDEIIEQYFGFKPDVLMGGGAGEFPPQRARRRQAPRRDRFCREIQGRRLRLCHERRRTRDAAGAMATKKLLGLFNIGNMDGALDRKFLKRGSVPKFPDQPDLTDRCSAALKVLSQNPNGFFLMVESGLIDKYTHLLDMERAVYDTIMFDNVVQAGARLGEGARRRHADPRASPITIIRSASSAPSTTTCRARRTCRCASACASTRRQASRIIRRRTRKVIRRASMSAGGSRCSRQACRIITRPSGRSSTIPTSRRCRARKPGTFEANERYKDVPGAVLRFGNLPGLPMPACIPART